jgi:glycosyltransferase involved in cell wall biosynthesis
MMALQAGVPVVTTSMPHSDADMVTSPAIRCVTMPASGDEFAQASVEFAADRAELPSRGAAGRALFDRNYAWNIIATQLVRALEAD